MDEVVCMRDGRAKNEFGIGQRFEFDRFARRLESREVPCRSSSGADACCDGDPEDNMTRRGHEYAARSPAPGAESEI
jgi:hypothetical protein